MTRGLGFAALALAGCGLAACGNVIVDDRGETGGEPGTGGGAPTAPTTTSSLSTTTSSLPTTTTSSSTTTWTTTTSWGPGTTGSGCVTSCAVAFTDGTMPCYGLGFALYGQLVGKVCDSMSPCDQLCQDNLCAFHASSSACTACIGEQNPDELQACLSN
jgi:hypothetical protein